MKDFKKYEAEREYIGPSIFSLHGAADIVCDTADPDYNERSMIREFIVPDMLEEDIIKFCSVAERFREERLSRKQ